MLSKVKFIAIPKTKSKEPISKKSKIPHSTALVSKTPSNGIIKRANGYNAFFEILKFIFSYLAILLKLTQKLSSQAFWIETLTDSSVLLDNQKYTRNLAQLL